jgi:hypothetical protein
MTRLSEADLQMALTGYEARLADINRELYIYMTTFFLLTSCV